MIRNFGMYDVVMLFLGSILGMSDLVEMFFGFFLFKRLGIQVLGYFLLEVDVRGLNYDSFLFIDLKCLFVFFMKQMMFVRIGEIKI